MATFSEVRFSQAVEEQRFGAEFWRPEYTNALRTDKNWTRIGDLLTRCQYGISREMNEIGVGTPIYRMNEMDGLFLTVPLKSVALDSMEHSEFRLSPGDVLFNRTNSYRFVGRTGILKEEIDAVFASYLIRITPDVNRLLPEYLTVYLNSPTGIAQVKRRAMESINQTNVSGSEIREVPIPLLSMGVQSNIAEVVNQAAVARQDALRVYAKAERELLDELKFSNFDSAMERVSIREFSRVALAGRWDAEYFRPDYWRVVGHCTSYKGGFVSLGDVVKSITNGVESRLFVDEGVPYIRVGDMRTLRIDSATSERIPASEARLLLPKVKLHRGDVLAARSGSIGQGAVVLDDDLESVISSHLMRIRPIDNGPVQATYLALFLSTLPGIQQVMMNGNGGIVPEISQPNLRKVIVPTPPLRWQSRIAELISESQRQEDEARRLMARAVEGLEGHLR